MDTLRERLRQRIGGSMGLGGTGQGGVEMGEANVAAVIFQQHLVLVGLLSQIRAGDANTRRALLPRLRQELIAHSKAEEATVYQALDRLGGTTEVEESVLEHMLMERVLKNMLALPADAPEWDRRFNELDQLITVFMSHVREEERELLPALVNRVSSEEVQDLGRRFMEVYRQVKQQLQP